MAITWSTIKSLFYETVGDKTGVNAFFSQAQLVGFCQESLREVADRTHHYDYAYAQSVTAGTEETTIGGNHLQIWRVEVDGEYIRPITADQIRKHDRFWRSHTGRIDWYLLDEYQTDTDALAIRWYEIPAADADFIVYSYGIPSAPVYSGDTTQMHVPEWFSYCILYGMLARAYEADTQMQNIDTADFFRMMFDDAIMRLRARSYARLGSAWSVPNYDPDASLSIWNRLPESITPP